MVDTEFRHNLIQDEFRTVLTRKAEDYQIPLTTDGIVVLSDPPLVNGEVVNEASPENISRIQRGIDVIRQFVAQKLGKSLDDVTVNDIELHGPPLILNGDTTQLSTMQAIAVQDFGFPQDKIQLLNCGERGQANTKTQFEVMNTDERYSDAHHFVLVTNSWHTPRVIRTADANLRPDINFDVIPVTQDLPTTPDRFYSLIRGEVRRIEVYSTRGDIARIPARGIMGD